MRLIAACLNLDRWIFRPDSSLVAMQLPAALRIVKTYFDTISHDYGEAALVDGTNLFSAYSPGAFLGVQQIDYGFL
jgi:hypothetical protein